MEKMEFSRGGRDSREVLGELKIDPVGLRRAGEFTSDMNVGVAIRIARNEIAREQKLKTPNK